MASLEEQLTFHWCLSRIAYYCPHIHLSHTGRTDLVMGYFKNAKERDIKRWTVWRQMYPQEKSQVVMAVYDTEEEAKGAVLVFARIWEY